MNNRGDTVYVILNYQINGSALEEGAYQEIELQINNQASFNSVKKLLSDDSIRWGTIQYLDDNDVEQTFTGYYAFLSQEETFRLMGARQVTKSNVQLRIMIGDEVGSSAITDLDLGNVLSSKVLSASAD